MRTQRLEKIEAFIYRHQAVTLDQLCDAFKVSKNTIRRDIDEIIKMSEGADSSKCGN